MSKHWILTSTKKRFDFLNPRVEDVELSDIAFALSHINRYTGHVGPYSVASHSLHVARIVETVLGRADLVLEALLHDAHEAYVGDVTAPLKRLLPEFQTIEARVDAVIREVFKLPRELSPLVQKADLMALHDEAMVFYGKNEVADWHIPEPLSGLTLEVDNQFTRVDFRRAIDLALNP